MANQVQGTVYQIDTTRQVEPIVMAFSTQNIIVREAALLHAPNVQSCILYYQSPGNSPTEYFVSEKIGELVNYSNVGEVALIQATIASSGQSFAFPSQNISIQGVSGGVQGANACIQYRGVPYYVTETEADLYAQSQGGAGGLVTLTKSQLDDAISSNSLTPGQFYKITGVNPDLYGGTDVILQAATSNQLESQGSGIFYNPNYGAYPIWSKYMSCILSNVGSPLTIGEIVTANNGATAYFLSNGLLDWISGDWSGATSILGNDSDNSADISGATSPTYNIGDKVIWGGKVWENLSGEVGKDSSIYSFEKGTSFSDWSAIAYNTDDYNVVVDEIKYDYAYDSIIYRKEYFNLNNNIVDIGKNYSYNSIKAFQWGNSHVNANMITNSYCENINFRGYIFAYNTMSQNSYFGDGNIFETDTIFTYNTLSDNSYIGGNTLSNNSIIDNNTFVNAAIYNSQLSQTSEIGYNNLNNSAIGYCQLTNVSTISINNLTQAFIGQILLYNNCNINNNNLLQNSNIVNNNLSNGSYIDYNSLDQQSYIQYNALYDTDSISYNSLTQASTISSNTLGVGNIINYNILSQQSDISANSLDSNCFIINNQVLNMSSIDNNSIDYSQIQYNDLTQQSNIGGNTLANSAYIYLNSLSNQGYIQNNYTNGGQIGINTISASTIISNTLGGGVSIDYNNLSQSSQIQFLNSGDYSITKNNLFNSSIDLKFTSGIANNLSNITMNYSAVEVDISGATDIYGDWSKNIIKDISGVFYLTYIDFAGLTQLQVVPVNN